MNSLNRLPSKLTIDPDTVNPLRLSPPAADLVWEVGAPQPGLSGAHAGAIPYEKIRRLSVSWEGIESFRAWNTVTFSGPQG